MIRQILKSRTMQWSLMLAIFGVIEANFSLFADVIGAKWYGLAFTAVGIVTAILRFLTTTSIGEK